ncbi:MAG: AAA family ATPase, partial [Clostridia bacterium]|nr:AAA family ATPase [Clostridia bacterium]
MRIEKIHIDSFMGKRDLTLELSAGVNILRGDNESGKSTLAEFIKFMLYGAAARGVDGTIPERQRYLSFGDTAFGGYMVLRTAAGHYRIDRTVHQTQSGFRESLAISDLDKKTQVFKGENAGDALLGIPEAVFKKIAYISQEGEAYTGGADLGAA